ncbi:MAG: ImmA/IrrE family metallo-endopeptidase [Xanthobacteraceae bacterium]|nr:ImmA/IrrE family metallo-endopeptidase [Xanthobacteraceae bacterium]MBX3533468.1 ImmA/IrrE family metallo-endopeptidase [Xanthobacteraceae bacterium]MCW5676408.1 ImmA/IrrE family metallo-endopeptidase [Xanthobacteraceae bacterium]
MVTRDDLKGTGSPDGLVTRILKAEPGLAYPIPIEDIARQLGIKEIAELETEAFEGGLLMDSDKTNGVILVNKAARMGRRRFTIGHELGHFCIPTHKPVRTDKFLCSRDDMRTWSAAEKDLYARMEMEANKFSALLLIPPPLLRPYLVKMGDPNLTQVIAIHDDFEVSKDAAARAFAQTHDGIVAVAVVNNGKVLRIYKHIKFPRIAPLPSNKVPTGSGYWSGAKNLTTPTELREVVAGQWLESEWGKKLPDLYEQVLFQQAGFALVMLWPEQVEEDDEDDPDENRTAKQRLAERVSRRYS